MPNRPKWLEDRMRRAVRQVLKTYKIEAVSRTPVAQTTGIATYSVHSGRKAYEVGVSDAWQHAPTCTCPDMKRVGDDQCRGFCKHAIAVLLHESDHRHQLIDLLF